MEENRLYQIEANLEAGQALSLTLNEDGAVAMGETKSFEDNGLVIAGPTNPLTSKRVQALNPTRFRDEPLDLKCEWYKDGYQCTFKTEVMDEFMDHVGNHQPGVHVENIDNIKAMKVVLNCQWQNCPWTHSSNSNFERHVLLHAYHTKLKCIGQNILNRTELNYCSADPNKRNILPDLSDLECAWGSCRQIFTNIQWYYDHINEHVEATPRGKNVRGGTTCGWRGCSSRFPNAVKLKDHVRSHTQEKTVACFNCGGLFSSRTKFFDHCKRQILLENETFACDVCMKYFSTARLLRDHIRAHVNTYRCHICEMSCPSPSALNNHMKYKHSDDKPYCCNTVLIDETTCTFRCKSYNDLIRHAKTHADTLFKCDVENCKFECKTAITLKSHFNKAHGDGMAKYACHECDNKYLKGYYLTKHLINKHKLQWPAGHSRFRYKINDDGFYRLLTVRYESIEEP